MPAETPSIRVSLRIGKRSDPQLLRTLATLPPYQRAKLLRRLLELGWRVESDPSAHRRGAILVSTLAPGRADPVAPPALTDEEVFTLIGATVRL